MASAVLWHSHTRGEKRRSHPISSAHLRQERLGRYRFIAAAKVAYPLGLLCRVMEVSPSAYHAYARGGSHTPGAKKAAIGERVKEVFARHRRRYGARRIAAELTAEGDGAGRFAVRTQMRRLGLPAISPRRFRPQTTDSRHSALASPNLLRAAANEPQEPGEVIVGDITYLPRRGGRWSYLASWQDTFSKHIVGWAVEDSMTAELAIKAFEKAIAGGAVKVGTIIHTDRGAQYVSTNFRALLAAQGCRQSMSRRGNCYDNAQAEVSSRASKRNYLRMVSLKALSKREAKPSVTSRVITTGCDGTQRWDTKARMSLSEISRTKRKGQAARVWCAE